MTTKQPDLIKIIKVKASEMNRITPFRAALMKAVERGKNDCKKVKKPVSVCYLPSQEA